MIPRVPSGRWQRGTCDPTLSGSTAASPVADRQIGAASAPAEPAGAAAPDAEEEAAGSVLEGASEGESEPPQPAHGSGARGGRRSPSPAIARQRPCHRDAGAQIANEGYPAPVARARGDRPSHTVLRRRTQRHE